MDKANKRRCPYAKRLLRWELIGFAFTGAVGTLLHFVYEWTGGNPLIAAFCAVNESTWGAHEAAVRAVLSLHHG